MAPHPVSRELPAAVRGDPPGGLVASLQAGAGSGALVLEAARLLGGRRELWAPAVLPVALAALALAGAAAGFVAWADELHSFLAATLPVLRAEAWWEWLWVGPGRALVWLLPKLALVLGFVLALVLAFVLANLAAAPFHEVLSRRVERLVTGDVREVTGDSFWGEVRAALRSVAEEAKRTGFFLAVSAMIVAAGVAIPGAQLLVPPALLALSLAFLPLDYASHALDRRRLPFAERRAWLTRHRGAMLGFGAAAFGLCAVPLLNLLAMPVLVVAGTLLVLRHPPEAESA